MPVDVKKDLDRIATTSDNFKDSKKSLKSQKSQKEGDYKRPLSRREERDKAERKMAKKEKKREIKR